MVEDALWEPFFFIGLAQDHMLDTEWEPLHRQTVRRQVIESGGFHATGKELVCHRIVGEWHSRFW